MTTTNGKPIGLNYARQLVKNYKENNLATGTIKKNDTQAVWFSKDVLLQALGLPAGSGSEDLTGIRFYFGAYAQEPGYPENSFDQNKLTIVMVQTGQSQITISRNGSPEIAYLDIIDDPTTQPSYPDNSGSVGVPKTVKSYYNDGQLSPPPMPTSNLGLLDW